ncbi:methyltransferase [Methylicorpusculum oleiharenae]|uniref:methyltransferase n=1 Tax=Methylicorpusculum oleiharenae TaxID=1338687 RepID=UPI00135B1662|nr:methyltransferase [Methylicorpusculum oleiharenae]MCD2451256.1 methyltransferase [Methylicorpusculum oleiharenae]
MVVVKQLESNADNRIIVPQGQFVLSRLPARRNELLRAWDAADELLLNELNQHGLPEAGSRILIINDGFGALTVALQPYAPVGWSDSYLSHQASRINLDANGRSKDEVTFLTSLNQPSGLFDLILIKAPKTLALLEHQLIGLRPLLKPGTRLIVAGMVKALTGSIWTLLETLIGPTTTSLAWKKARLIDVKPDSRLPVPVNPYPGCYKLEGTDFDIVNHANVFSRERLDIGARFFLEQLAQWPDARDIIDLGCGNGVIGLMASAKNPGAVIHFVDESYMAVASARENFLAAFGNRGAATFRSGDCLNEFKPGSADVILCNPPFHQQHTVGDMIAVRMFKQARQVLNKKGALWVIGNRHLGYHQTLKTLFRQVSLVAGNAKFVVFKATG